MAGDTLITVVGNLTGDPELRFTPSGAAVANFTVASTPRMFDRQTSEWKDGETLFMRCSIWREAAESVAESLHRGTRVIVTGRLVSRSWDDKETGQKRTVMEMQVDEIGPSLRYATAKVTKTERSGGGRGFGSGQGNQDNDPWATGGGQGGQSGGAQSGGQGGWNQGGQGSGSGGQGGQGGYGGQSGQGSGGQGGWNSAPSYDEPPF
ncbi:MAG: single-stranded DNA-binding protein [Actinomycetia bacterium]|nr:single-stranded DNA-binding protein [Actinomycetes bacterium]